MKKLVIVLSAASGFGHIKAGDALAQQMKERFTDCEIVHENLCSFTPSWQKWLIETGWEISSTKAPLRPIYSLVHRTFTSSDFLGTAFNKLYYWAGKALANRFRGAEIKAVIAMHPSGVAAAVHWKRQCNFKLFVVATDFVLHSLQCVDGVDYVFAQEGVEPISGRARRLMKTSKFIPGRLPTGIVTRSLKNDTDIALRVIVSFGAKGLSWQGSIKKIINALRNLSDVQAVFVCGFNKQLFAFLKIFCVEEIASGRFEIHLFRRDIGLFYQNVDVFVGKAGGVSCSEAIALGIPILVTDCLPGQEEHNLRFILRGGHGLDCRRDGSLEKALLAFRNEKAQKSEDVEVSGGSSTERDLGITSKIAALANIQLVSEKPVEPVQSEILVYCD